MLSNDVLVLYSIAFLKKVHEKVCRSGKTETVRVTTAPRGGLVVTSHEFDALYMLFLKRSAKRKQISKTLYYYQSRRFTRCDNDTAAVHVWIILLW